MSYLIQPVQRVPRYEMLLKEIVKRQNESDPSRQAIQKGTVDTGYTPSSVFIMWHSPGGSTCCCGSYQREHPQHGEHVRASVCPKQGDKH